MDGFSIFMLIAFVIEIYILYIRTKNEAISKQNEEKAKQSREKYFDNKGYLIKRDSGVDVRLEPYYEEIYFYDKKDPYYRTIAFKNVATTELVDNSRWKSGGRYKTNKYMLVVNNRWWNRRLYLDDSLVESAKSAQIPHLLFDEQYYRRAYCIDLSDYTGLHSQYPTDVRKEEKFIAETTSLLSKEEGEKIVRWMKGYDN